ncbi:MAG: hypothetical protein RIE32_07870 [Phycisphaerales bacterium]
MPASIRAAVLAPCLAPCLAAALAPAALAQTAITIEVENPVLMPGESTVVTMWAGFDPSDYAMQGIATRLRTSVGSDGWSDARLVFPMNGPGSSPGAASTTGYDGILAGQLHALGEIYADTSNPIAFWEAVYTAPPAPEAFDVWLSTATMYYAVYTDPFSPGSESRLPDLTEGAATIRVIPAPASALVLAGGVLAQRRRR